jgi:predicted murein hydrolase (TIGR00659 family)
MGNALAFILLTVAIYYVMKKVYARFYTPLLSPIVTTTLVIVMILFMFHISYKTYMGGGKWIGKLLGPAVVALAFPLYHHRQTLKQFFWPIFQAVFSGAAIGMISGAWFASIFHLDKKLLRSLLPKSVTSPVAMDIAKEIGGIPTLAAVYVMIAGIFGAIFGPSLLRIFNITHPLGVGIGLGSASHGIGTAKALEIGKEEAAISSIAMTLSAIFAALFCPIVLIVLS